MQSIGKILIIAGLIIFLSGILVYFAGNKLNWFGNLPGDIKIKKENFSLFFPVTTMLILSIVISLVLWLFGKFFR